MHRFWFCFFLTSLLSIETALAIPPPDFFINIFQQFLQLFGIITAFVIVAFYQTKAWVINFYYQNKKQVKLSGLILVIVLIFSLIFSYFWSVKQEQVWKTQVTSEIKNVIETAEKKIDPQILADLKQRHLDISLAGSEKKDSHILLSRDGEIDWDTFRNEFFNEEGTLIIDLREKVAFDYGHYPGSVHSRLADFVFGDWQTINLDEAKNIIVVCYVSTSGALVTEFLRKLGYTNVYFLKNGLVEAVEQDKDDIFEGEVFFSEQVWDIQDLSSAELLPEWQGIDTRSNAVFETKGRTGNLNLYWEMTTTPEIEKFAEKLDKTKTYYSVCDSGLTCYSASILQGYLEKRGFIVQGRLDWRNTK